MGNLNITDPFILILGGIALLIVIYFWNKSNNKKLRERKNRNFRDRYQQKKQERNK